MNVSASLTAIVPESRTKILSYEMIVLRRSKKGEELSSKHEGRVGLSKTYGQCTIESYLGTPTGSFAGFWNLSRGRRMLCGGVNEI